MHDAMHITQYRNSSLLLGNVVKLIHVINTPPTLNSMWLRPRFFSRKLLIELELNNNSITIMHTHIIIIIKLN